MAEVQAPEFIYLYDGAGADNVNLPLITEYLSTKLPRTGVQIRGDVLTHGLSLRDADERNSKLDSIARDLTHAKIHNPAARQDESPPLPAEVDFERKWLLKQPRKPFGILYDGLKLQQVHLSLLAREEKTLAHLHVVLTNQLFGTWDAANMRYHARVSLYSMPCIISTTGLVEAPAKPREYYLLRQSGMGAAELRRRFKGGFLDYGDPRLTEALKGYVMQAVFYWAFGNPFCDDKNCRLFNAHWQQEVIQAQLDGNYEFCPHHEDLLRQMA